MCGPTFGLTGRRVAAGGSSVGSGEWTRALTVRTAFAVERSISFWYSLLEILLKKLLMARAGFGVSLGPG